MKKIIGPLLIILVIGGIGGGIWLVNRNLKHKDEVKDYKKTLKGVMSTLSKDTDDVEKAIKELLTEWEVTARAYGSSEIGIGALEDVLNQTEQKNRRETLLKQLKVRSDDRKNLLKKIEDYPKGEKALCDDVLEYWDIFCSMADTYANITLVKSYESCATNFAAKSARKAELYDKIMKQIVELSED